MTACFAANGDPLVEGNLYTTAGGGIGSLRLYSKLLLKNIDTDEIIEEWFISSNGIAYLGKNSKWSIISSATIKVNDISSALRYFNKLALKAVS